MKTTKSRLPASDHIWDAESPPEVWWGEHGIDALISPKPYTLDTVPLAAASTPDPSTPPERS